MRTLLTATNLIVGDELNVIREGYMLVEDGRIVEIGTGNRPTADRTIRLDKCAVIPGLINAHTHVGDSAFQDIGIGKTLDELFKPPDGLKHSLLRSTPQTLIKEACRDTIIDMLSSGITTFADFREGGVDGIKILHHALEGLRMRALIFGRPSYTFQTEELENNTALLPEEAIDSIEEADRMLHGYAPSAPNDLTDQALEQLASTAEKHGRFKATHAAEHPDSTAISKKRTGLSEVERAIKRFKADILVHLTYASQEDLKLVSTHGVSVVCCPSANALLGLNLPPIPEMLNQKTNVALGTDNTMLNPPSMMREMAFVLRMYGTNMLAERPITPREVLSMGTISGARALRIDNTTGSIKEGKSADIVVLDFDAPNLRYTQDVVAAVVHRARDMNVKLVMIGGEIVYDRDLEHTGRTSSEAA